MLRDGQRVVGVAAGFLLRAPGGGACRTVLQHGCVVRAARVQVSQHAASHGDAGAGWLPLHQPFPPSTGRDPSSAGSSSVRLTRRRPSSPTCPGLRCPAGRRISADPDVIEETLAGAELELYRDHARALAVHHHVLIRGQDSCYVMHREFRHKDVPLYAVLLHVSNPELFRRALIPLTRHLLLRHRLVATLGELRIIGHQPRLSFELNAWPKMYRSDSLDPAQIDNLYSELVCVPWSGHGCEKGVS